jgi:hypothetical protein
MFLPYFRIALDKFRYQTNAIISGAVKPRREQQQVGTCGSMTWIL